MNKCNPKKCFQVLIQPQCASVALLIVRVVVGIAFAHHGWGKIQNPFGWMGPDAPVPGFFQLLAAVSEFGGGIFWVLGLLMPLSSLGIAFTMVGAVFTHMVVMGDPFVSQTGGSSYELALVYLSLALLFLAQGPGKFSLDSKIFGNRPPC